MGLSAALIRLLEGTLGAAPIVGGKQTRGRRGCCCLYVIVKHAFSLVSVYLKTNFCQEWRKARLSPSLSSFVAREQHGSNSNFLLRHRFLNENAERPVVLREWEGEEISRCTIEMAACAICFILFIRNSELMPRRFCALPERIQARVSLQFQRKRLINYNKTLYFTSRLSVTECLNCSN